jgi:methyl-accepting chemotaxis protein
VSAIVALGDFMENKKKRNLFDFIVYFLLFLFLIVVLPSIEIVLKLPAVTVIVTLIIVYGITIGFCFLFVLQPLRKLEDKLITLNTGDFDINCELRHGIYPIKRVFMVFKIFINSIVDNLIKGIKINILKTQDSSDVFLTEVQKAVTNASRISIGAFYIGTKVVNLDSLLEDSLNENNTIKNNIEEYGNLLKIQTTSINETSDVLNGIVHMLEKSILRVEENKKLSHQMSDVTKSGNVKVTKTVKAVKEIADALVVIKDTIKIVAEVASRTNLLAMNASIEAAHAGKAGAGFAVVADEIRKLAEATSKQVKNITQSLKGVTNLIEEAVSSSSESGGAFNQISEAATEFIAAFDEMANDYTTLAKKNEDVGRGFSGIRDFEIEISTRIQDIGSRIENTIKNLGEIQKSNNEIRVIVDRNEKEALQLSRGQTPIYANAVENGEKLECIRKSINHFHLTDTSRDMWLSDKTELYNLIEATFSHLNWTVRVLDYLHGESEFTWSEIMATNSKFDNWLKNVNEFYKKQDTYKKIITCNKQIIDKVKIMEQLVNGNKEQEATIEFSEMLEISRQMMAQMAILKQYVIKNRINSESTRNFTDKKKRSIDLIDYESLETLENDFILGKGVSTKSIEKSKPKVAASIQELKPIKSAKVDNSNQNLAELQDFINTL